MNDKPKPYCMQLSFSLSRLCDTVSRCTSTVFMNYKKKTGQPSRIPSSRPSGQPSRQPTRRPSHEPSRQPTMQPSRKPSSQPTRQPIMCPTGRLQLLSRSFILITSRWSTLSLSHCCILTSYGRSIPSSALVGLSSSNERSSIHYLYICAHFKKRLSTICICCLLSRLLQIEFLPLPLPSPPCDYI